MSAAVARETSSVWTPPQSEDEDIKQSQASDNKKTTTTHESGTPADSNIPDDYVKRTLAREPALPPIKLSNILNEIQWVSTIVLTTTPILAIYGAFTTPLQRATFIWSVVYYFMTGLGITAGYHRLWAHKAYNASPPLQYWLAAMGSGAVQGSIHWWARGHRAHHRYTDTDLDPYGAHNGLLWSHLGWMILKPRRKPGVADISDLRRNPVIKWQHRFYLPLILIMGFLFPTVVAGLGWGDWRGGFYYAGVARLVFVHHSTFCVNSLAHWLGEATFDNKMTPRDHFITALVTVGEGYHNFHHQFPMDYRNATKWWQYDPTRTFIQIMAFLGLASHLRVFPDNEVRKGRLAMELHKLESQQAKIAWPKSSNHLPVISWADFTQEAKTRPLVVVNGFIHDVSTFMDDHPGGRHLISARIGKDASVAFSGGVYDHSNAAHNLLSMMRVGVLHGGYQVALQNGQELLDPSTPELSDAVSSDGDDGPATPVNEPADHPVVASAVSSSQAAADLKSGDVKTIGIHPKAAGYVTPGETYTILKRGDLTANKVASANGKVGSFMWDKKKKVA